MCLCVKISGQFHFPLTSWGILAFDPTSSSSWGATSALHEGFRKNFSSHLPLLKCLLGCDTPPCHCLSAPSGTRRPSLPSFPHYSGTGVLPSAATLWSAPHTGKLLLDWEWCVSSYSSKCLASCLVPGRYLVSFCSMNDSGLQSIPW